MFYCQSAHIVFTNYIVYKSSISVLLPICSACVYKLDCVYRKVPTADLLSFYTIDCVDRECSIADLLILCLQTILCTKVPSVFYCRSAQLVFTNEIV